ncbi:ATP-binding cassette domain-containing protein [Caldilinea sp.]|jgi:simple sugar transport system ATP-binding protein|uniref:ATP-binding cassette domain-containing protein n=2 Tax=Caldilinea TaxID=233191 RepID=UPI0021DDBD88|nr:ATP-binding cassette domain-containing protein [Caldilinea sp.]GIV68830.1 MAG: ABC transporter ATP-binding protein [Caldilinea sp.]
MMEKQDTGVQPVLRAVNLTKRFGGLVAVNDVSLDIYPGEVVALAGDNGAGKSTLIKMISGVYRPDAGHIYLEGREITMASPLEARNLGIETIYQDLALCENLDATVNIFLGREPTKRLFGLFKQVDRNLMLAESNKVLDRLDIHIPNLRRPIRQMSGGQRQAVAIARAVYWNAKLVIMDEPTAALGVPEQRKVHELIHTLKRQNVPVIIISHNLQDIFAVADRIVVMRRGYKVGDVLASEVTDDDLVAMMVGSA